MIYNEFPVKMDDGFVVQLQDSVVYPVNQFGSDGSKTPKLNAAGEKQWEVPVVMTSTGAGGNTRMTMEKVKVWAPENPVEHIGAGSILSLMEPVVYVGVTNDGKKFYGLKAAAVAKAGK